MVSKWILKAVVQKTISFLPFRHRINYFFQKHVTKGVYLTDEYFTDRLIHAGNHLKYYHQFAKGAELKNTLELGTGWYPVVPVSFFLAGASSVFTVDISSLSNREHVLTTLKKFCDYHESGKLSSYFSIREGRMKVLKDLVDRSEELSLEDLIRRLHLKYLIQDARHLTLESNLIDLVHSNNTFEHVYPTVLEAILIEFQRVCRPGGIQSHFVDMSDHFAHFDSSINIYNYLRFSDQQWEWIDNDIQPQNRWRVSDYQALYQRLGVKILYLDCRDGNMEQLQSIDLDPKYHGYPMKDLAVSHCHIISAEE